MRTRSIQDMKKALGLFLICGWFVVILYSSYRIEQGLTDIGYSFILFLKRVFEFFRFASLGDLNWLEEAFNMIVHLEAFVLLGVFAGAATTWWDLKGRRRWVLILLLGLAIALVDEGYQCLVLDGDWNSLDLIWEVMAVVIGLKIDDFVAFSNR